MATIKAAILGHNECGAGEGGQEAGVTTLDFYPTITPPPPPGIELSTNLCRNITITEKAPTRVFCWLKAPHLRIF